MMTDENDTRQVVEFCIRITKLQLMTNQRMLLQLMMMNELLHSS